MKKYYSKEARLKISLANKHKKSSETIKKMKLVQSNETYGVNTKHE